MAGNLKTANLIREEIYEKVWTTPINTIAKELSLRDYDIVNFCDKNNVPRPPSGYWSKFRHGQRIERSPLSKDFREANGVIPGPFKKEVVKKEKIPSGIFQKNKKALNTRTTSGQQHPLVEKTYQAYRNVTPDKTDRLRTKEAALNVWVGYRSLDRALSFMDFLIKDLAEQNISVSIERNQYGDQFVTQASINGVWVPFHVEETVEKVTVPKDRNQSWRDRNIEYSVSGVLNFTIDNYLGECRLRSWGDTKSSQIEEKIPLIIDGLIQAAVKLKIIREDEEKIREQRQIEEAKRREIEEQEKFKKQQIAQLGPCSADWEKADRIRRFASAMETAAIKKFGLIDSKGPMAAFIKLANSHADSIDPVIQTLKSFEQDLKP